MAVVPGRDDDARESGQTLELRIFVLERAAVALERSASFAAQHAVRHEQAGQFELAERERRAGEQAGRAAARARRYAGGLSELSVGT